MKKAKNPFRYMGSLNVITRVDHTFNMLDEMAELASTAASETVTEKQIHALLLDTNNVCLAAYREGNEDTPRDLEGFIIVNHIPDRPRRIMIIGLAMPDNTALLRIFLDRLREYSPLGVCIAVDIKARAAFQALDFIIAKRVGNKYAMLRK